VISEHEEKLRKKKNGKRNEGGWPKAPLMYARSVDFNGKQNRAIEEN